MASTAGFEAGPHWWEASAVKGREENLWRHKLKLICQLKCLLAIKTKGNFVSVANTSKSMFTIQ